MTDSALWTTTLLHIEHKRLLQAIPAHRPDDGRIGDCYRTAVACLIGWGGEVESVPHFVEERMELDGDADWSDFRRARHWCRLLDLDLLNVERATAVEHDVPYIARVRSKTGPWAHSVIGQGDLIVWDPSGHQDGYTIDDLATDDGSVEVVCEPYEPDPDAMVRHWIALTADPPVRTSSRVQDEMSRSAAAETVVDGPDSST